MNYEFLTSVYGASSIPVIISDLKYNILWSNDVYKKSKRYNAENTLIAILGDEPQKSGLYYYKNEKCIYTYNVIFAKEFIVTEEIHVDKIANIFNNPAVQDYLDYINACIRKYITNVTVAADEIYSAVKKNIFGDTTCSCLNAIDNSMMELLGKIVDAETLINIAKSDDEDKTICVSESLEKLAAEVKGILKGKIEVTADIEPIVYARYHKSAFDMVIADLTTACLDVPIMTESMAISLKTLANDNVKICISAEHNPDKANKNYVSNDVTTKNIMYSKYVLDTFCDRYGGHCTKTIRENGVSYMLELPAIPNHKPLVSRSMYYENANSRFSVVSLRLMKYREKERFDSKTREVSLTS